MVARKHVQGRWQRTAAAAFRIGGAFGFLSSFFCLWYIAVKEIFVISSGRRRRRRNVRFETASGLGRMIQSFEARRVQSGEK